MPAASCIELHSEIVVGLSARFIARTGPTGRNIPDQQENLVCWMGAGCKYSFFRRMAVVTQAAAGVLVQVCMALAAR